jgi:hypothetical protein
MIIMGTVADMTRMGTMTTVMDTMRTGITLSHGLDC